MRPRTYRPRRRDGVKVFRVQAGTQDFGGPYTITVPATVARLIGPDREFSIELTDQGIVYRYIAGGEPVALPEWLR